EFCRRNPRSDRPLPLETPPIGTLARTSPPPNTMANDRGRKRVSLFDPASFLIISLGIFAGAVVSGLLGFAFSAVAGAILLHVLPPTEAVPLMMACSIVTQGVSLVALRGTVKWRGSPVLIAGGLVGILPAFYLLHTVDVRIFRIGFGMFLA